MGNFLKHLRTDNQFSYNTEKDNFIINKIFNDRLNLAIGNYNIENENEKLFEKDGEFLDLYNDSDNDSDHKYKIYYQPFSMTAISTRA